MDVNGLPIEGFQSINLSAGLGAAPPLSASGQTPYVAPGAWINRDTGAVTESEMEHLILEYKDARSDEEAEKLLEDLPANQRDRVLDELDRDAFS